MKDTLSRVLATLAVLVGVGTLAAAYVLWTMITDNKTAFTDMLQGYEQRIAALEEWRAQQEQQAQAPEDTRALMPEGYMGTLAPITPPPDELVSYENAAIGLAMKVPYNAKWGNRLYRVAPYEERTYQDTNGVMRTLVHFGPSFIFEGGGWARGSTLTVSDPLDPNEELTHLQQVNDGFLDDRPIERVDVNGKTVFVYYTGGLCSYVHVTVVGVKANYTLTPTCGDSDEIREEFLNIVRTMTFID